MSKFKELERFRLANSLQFGTVTNNNANGTYDVYIDGKCGQLQESEMCKVWQWSNLRSKIEDGINKIMDLTVAKMILIFIISAILVSCIAFIHALFLMA